MKNTNGDGVYHERRCCDCKLWARNPGDYGICRMEDMPKMAPVMWPEVESWHRCDDFDSVYEEDSTANESGGANA